MKRQKNRIQLSEHERTRLERIKSKHTTPQNEAKRAHIILLADEGVAYLEIARRLMINKETVTTWVKRWNDSPEAGAHERLKDLPRPGLGHRINSPQNRCVSLSPWRVKARKPTGVLSRIGRRGS